MCPRHTAAHARPATLSLSGGVENGAACTRVGADGGGPLRMDADGQGSAAVPPASDEGRRFLFAGRRPEWDIPPLHQGTHLIARASTRSASARGGLNARTCTHRATPRAGLRLSSHAPLEGSTKRRLCPHWCVPAVSWQASARARLTCAAPPPRRTAAEARVFTSATTAACRLPLRPRCSCRSTCTLCAPAAAAVAPPRATVAPAQAAVPRSADHAPRAAHRNRHRRPLRGAGSAAEPHVRWPRQRAAIGAGRARHGAAVPRRHGGTRMLHRALATSRRAR